MFTCSYCIRHIHPENVYELRKTSFQYLDALNIPYRDEPEVLKRLAIFDFESICSIEDFCRETETTNWIRKHLPIRVSFLSSLIQEALFRCTTDLHHLVSSFVTTLQRLATRSKNHRKVKFIEIERAIKIKLWGVLEQLNQRHNRTGRVVDFVEDCSVESEEQYPTTQFLQTQKHQIFDLLNTLDVSVKCRQSSE